ncbi:MAG: hypothetical protein E7578_05040 [Ruminococcaceae bacterium]|nr:hypothetical protein [Oscillospiraceae bacterium]
MKNLVTVLLVTVLLTAFSACGEKNEKVNGTEGVSTTIPEEKDTQEIEEPKDCFFNKVNYTSEKEEPTVYSDSYYSVRTTYNLKEKTDRSLPVDTTLDSMNITLNSTKIGDLIKNGWTLVNGNKADDPIKSHQNTNTIVNTTGDKKAMVYAANTTDSTIKFSECLIRDVNVRYDDKVVYYDGLNEASDFVYSGAISSVSSPEDVISVLGDPDHIYTTEAFEDEMLSNTDITFIYKGSNGVNVRFEFKNEDDHSKMFNFEIQYS